MKTFAFALALVLYAGWATICPAGQTNDPPAISVPVIQVDWQPPQSLPRRFRNHCTIAPDSGRPYCSDHCGLDYQFYFCSRESFGCCRPGFGYCDWNDILRCHP
jgi:hypothetical protein